MTGNRLHSACITFPGFQWAGQVQTFANEGREALLRQEKRNQETTVQPWGRVLVSIRETVKVAQSRLTLCDPRDYTYIHMLVCIRIHIYAYIYVYIHIHMYTCYIYGVLQARTLEWEAYRFSSGSSLPRNWTKVSLIAGRFFINWAIGEAHPFKGYIQKYLWAVLQMLKPPPAGRRKLYADHKHTDPRLVGSRWMMPTPSHLITNQAEESPWGDYALLLEHWRLLTIPSTGSHSFEGISPPWPCLTGKAIKLLFPTSPKSLTFNSLSGSRE